MKQSFKARREAWAEFLAKKLPVVDLSDFPGLTAPLTPEAAALPPPPPIRTMTDAELMRLKLVTEEDFQQQVEQTLSLFRWKFYHTRDSRGSEADFPDLIALRPPRKLVAELKKIGKEPTDGQCLWLEYFKACGFEVFVWKPSDIDEVLRVLR